MSGEWQDCDGQTQLVTGNHDPPNNSSKISDTGGGVSAAKTVNYTPECEQQHLNIHSLDFLMIDYSVIHYSVWWVRIQG